MLVEKQRLLVVETGIYNFILDFLTQEMADSKELAATHQKAP